MTDRTRRILFVDDEPPVLSSLTRYFEHNGFETHGAPTGREGVQAFETVRPDVTVLDLHLPDLSGLDVLERIRRKKGMVIMLTGDHEIENAVEAMRRGAENFLTKPIDMSHLVVAVEKALEKVQLERENVQLRAQLSPTLRRRLFQAAAFAGLVVGSATLGSLIGRGPQERDRPAPPVRIQPADTTTPPVESPLLPGMDKSASF
jgi:DNA-binding response OmpR family regulator